MNLTLIHIYIYTTSTITQSSTQPLLATVATLNHRIYSLLSVLNASNGNCIDLAVAISYLLYLDAYVRRQRQTNE